MSHARGYFFIAAAAIFWGISATTAKLLFNAHYTPLVIVQMRVSIAAIFLFVFFFFTNRDFLKIHLNDIPLFSFVGVCGVAGSNYFYYAAIKETTVSLSILVQYTAPVMVMVYTTLFQHEQLTKYKIGALVLSLVGIFFAVGGYDENIFRANSIGIIFALLAAVSFAIFNIAGKILTKTYSVWTALMYVLATASIFWLFINTPLAIIKSGYTAHDWIIFTIISTVSILIPYGFYFFGLLYIQPSRAIITSTLEPIIAIISAWLFLQGTMNGIQICGAVCVLAAIILLQFQPTDTEVTIAHE